MAIRGPVSINGHGHWLLVTMPDESAPLAVEVLDDDAVAAWPELAVYREGET